MAALAVALGHAGCTSPGAAAPAATVLDRIDHVVIIVAENRSFDHLFGAFPGAEGLAQARASWVPQVDHDGRPLPTLPPVFDDDTVVERFPRELPNAPFRIDAPPVGGHIDEVLPSPVHRFYQHREQIDDGRNDRFVASGDSGAWPMGHFDGATLRLWRWAREYTLADHFFMAAFGGSFLNHQWLICACTPRFDTAPQALRAHTDADGRLLRLAGSPGSVMQGPLRLADGAVTPDGFAVNTVQPPFQPSGIPPAAGGDRRLANPAGNPLPPQAARTIGDTLDAKGVSWAWYAGGWRRALADGEQPPDAKRRVIYRKRGEDPVAFQPHHQPFNYHARYAPGSPERERHLRDGEDFFTAIDAGTLPRVSFYKPSGMLTEHPSYTDLARGDAHLDEVLTRLRASPQWPRMMIVVTYDENGGYWDHVPPPRGPGFADRWGPGSRVPTIVVSPFARRGFVDSTVYDTTSILKLLTRRFGLEPLAGVREKVGDLSATLQSPWTDPAP